MNPTAMKMRAARRARLAAGISMLEERKVYDDFPFRQTV
jgi:hypothetical protein